MAVFAIPNRIKLKIFSNFNFAIIALLLVLGCSKTPIANNAIPKGSITSFDTIIINNGTLVSGRFANEVTSILTYYGGNGGNINEQSILSDSIHGLTAKISSSKLNNGKGILTCTISGIPDSIGVVNFNISIGGINCILSREVIANNNPNIGDIYGGGIVAYLYAQGDRGYIGGETHGIIIAKSNIGTAEWGCQYSSCGNTSIAIGFGLYNTNEIVSHCQNANIAARLCFDLTLNGYSDWFLPSNNELLQLYKNGGVINQTADFIGGRGFSLNTWSSSENDSFTALYLVFYNGIVMNVATEKKNKKVVHAIRSF
jgi:hypothetical protein